MEIGELKKLFDDMTIEEKAGQLFQTVGAMYDDEAVISGPMQEMGITEKDIQLAGTVLGTMGAEKIKRIQKKYMETHHNGQEPVTRNMESSLAAFLQAKLHLLILPQ